ncbi:MAG: hypothetical protein AMXMBFR47_13150 [Planctomycetota bacterium]
MNMAWGVANFDTLTACVACSRCTQREHAYAEEAARVRVALLRELVANRESLVATHLSLPSCLPCGGRRRRVSLGAGAVGVLSASWAAEAK